MLETPSTLRRPRASEVPPSPLTLDKLKEAETAIIEPGFVFRRNDKPDAAYTFFAAINVNNAQLWEVFVALAKLLPDEVGCIYGVFDEDNDLHYSKYIDKKNALEIFGHYEREIKGDCDLQVSLVNNNDDQQLQVSISEVKYISFWGTDEGAFRKVMESFGLQEIPNLRFMDEFPVAVTPLTKVDKLARSTKNVVTGIYKLLDVIPVDEESFESEN